MTDNIDTSRIPLILDLLEQHWIKHPDWRFGHLISNILEADFLFHLTDFEVINLLENFGETGSE